MDMRTIGRCGGWVHTCYPVEKRLLEPERPINIVSLLLSCGSYNCYLNEYLWNDVEIKTILSLQKIPIKNMPVESLCPMFICPMFICPFKIATVHGYYSETGLGLVIRTSATSKAD